MFIFKHGARCVQSFPLAGRSSCLATRSYASRISIPFSPPPVPVIDACPAATCQCRDSPPDLDIEREKNINGSMASYAEQVLISTGRNDWKSKIEDEDEGVLVKMLKGLLGPRGKYSDPYHNVLLTNSSFAPSRPEQQKSFAKTNGESTTSTTASASAYLLPSFQYIPSIPTEPARVEDFVKAFILPSELHKSHDLLSPEQKNMLLRAPERQRQFIGARPIDEILVLICGHGGRDERCGKLGPVLQAEFQDKLAQQNITVRKEAPSVDAKGSGATVDSSNTFARVGLISHIGGHKWAGNVIIYIPPTLLSNPLAGRGIWYGRVAPEHVEGIVLKTIIEGTVIKEFFRGGIDQSGKILRL